MNLKDLMKQMKVFQESFEEIKRNLRERKDIVEKEGIELVFNGMGEILDIEVKDEELLRDWKKMKLTLIEAINEALDRARDIQKEELQKKFGGLLGGLGLGF